MSASETFSPVGYSVVTRGACTLRPVVVVVCPIKSNIRSKERNGQPAQVLLISLNKQCSIGFHLEVPGG
jgi:hypothetical protein